MQRRFEILNRLKEEGSKAFIKSGIRKFQEKVGEYLAHLRNEEMNTIKAKSFVITVWSRVMSKSGDMWIDGKNRSFKVL